MKKKEGSASFRSSKIHIILITFVFLSLLSNYVLHHPDSFSECATSIFRNRTRGSVELEPTTPVFLSACTASSNTNSSDLNGTSAQEELELRFDLQHAVRPEFWKAMNRYINLHRRILKRDPNVERKFVVAAPSGQLCNRIRGMVSAFTLAFLTDRAFIMTQFGYGETSYHDLFVNPGFDIENMNGIGGTGASISMDVGDGQAAEAFTCTDWEARKDPVIRLQGAAYINTYLYRNPHLQKKIQLLFLDDDLYRPILFWLFRPRPDIVSLKTAFIQQHLQGPYLVTFHIRTNFPVTEPEFRAYNQCATAVTPPRYRSSARWFVATDSSQARAEVLSKLSNASVFYSPDKFVVGDKRQGLRQALVDILVASEGDQIFLTPFSSYSRTIALYARTPHVYMVTDYGLPEQDPHRTLTRIGDMCYRFLSKEDCVWHGHLTSVGDALRKISCYTPAMIPDYC